VITTDAEAFLSQLRPGDVLLFDSVHMLSELIKFAENRPVNHCTVYLGNGELAQVRGHTPGLNVRDRPLVPAARKENLRDRLAASPAYDRTISALRHVATPSGSAGAEAVVKRAREYVEPEDTTYSYLSLIALMVPSLFRTYENYFQDPGAARRVGNLLRLVSQSLLDALDTDVSTPSKNKKTLTCSEFVYRCYDEAQPRMPIRVHNPLGHWDVSTKSLRDVLRRARSDPSAGPQMRGPGGVAEPELAPNTVVNGEGLIAFNPSLRTDLAVAEELSTPTRGMTTGIKKDLAVLAGETFLEILKHNIRLKKYESERSTNGAKGEVVPDLVTPRDLWSSESLEAVAVLHRPAGPERDLDDIDNH